MKLLKNLILLSIISLFVYACSSKSEQKQAQFKKRLVKNVISMNDSTLTLSHLKQVKLIDTIYQINDTLFINDELVVIVK
jgi:uncharacterized protein YcfL